MEKNELLKHLRDIQLKFSRLYAHILIEEDLTLPQYALLNQLATTDFMTMTDISEKLLISKPAVTHLVDRLEAKNCLKRLPDPKDRRIFLIKLAPKGERIVRKIRSYVLDFLLKTLEGFNQGQKDIISRFYATLSKTMDEELLVKGGRNG